ncbi:MAG TPA: gamma-glutamyl-gamma-aminobutyrate hydrolase family protein [Gemmatimonadaceae bacterium]|nr:gamma-glutamyl-gamma-aminobutyrate hydrolase family protein [Gemmatimonadaceae bacterium]
MHNRTVLVSSTRRIDGDTDRVRLNSAYVTALENAGLIPLIVPPLGRVEHAFGAMSLAAGLVLSGGGDLDPALYGEPLHPKANPPDATRDATELALIAAAKEAKAPVLAICRGIQAVNVALGGSLIQDISSELDSAIAHDAQGPREARTHEVAIMPGSRLARAVGSTKIAVNSLHHQSVGRLAPGLLATGHSPDGVVEGLESADEWWLLGVQWHPEEMSGSEEPWDRRLFEAFARAVRRED